MTLMMMNHISSPSFSYINSRDDNISLSVSCQHPSIHLVTFFNGMSTIKTLFSRLQLKPNQQRTLMYYTLSSNAEILLISTNSAYKSAPKVQKKRVCNVYVFQLSFHFAYHRWWLGSVSFAPLPSSGKQTVK